MYETWSQAGEERGPRQEGRWRRRWSTEPPERSLDQVPGLGDVPIILLAYICIQGRVFFNQRGTNCSNIQLSRPVTLRQIFYYWRWLQCFNGRQTMQECLLMQQYGNMIELSWPSPSNVAMILDDTWQQHNIYRCVSPTYKWCNDAANPCTHRGRTKSNVANLDDHVFTTLHCKKHKMEKSTNVSFSRILASTSYNMI